MSRQRITSGMLLDGTVAAIDLAAGAASTNVGTLAGVLGGTLPSPTLADNVVTTTKIADSQVTSVKIADGTIATGDLAANAISQVVTVTSNTAESTTSGTAAAMTAPVVSFTANGGVCLAIFTGCVYNSAAAGTADSLFQLRVDGVNAGNHARFYNPGVSWRVQIAAMANLGALSGAHTLAVYWSTGAGTLTSDTILRVLTLIELKR